MSTWRAGHRSGSGGSFKTDADISASRSGGGRPLQRWVADPDVAVPEGVDLTLESSSGSRKKWNQFAANREKFGIKPTYDERLYTTEIDTSHPEFAQREKRAAQLAAEIEAQGHGGNAHLAEERGVIYDDSGLDEEDKYSGVERSQPERSGADRNPSDRQHGGDRAQSERRRGSNSAEGFAAAEARKAMGQPGYVRRREKAERANDARKLSQDPRVQGATPPEIFPKSGKSHKAEKQEKKAAERQEKAAQSAASGSASGSTSSSASGPSAGSAASKNGGGNSGAAKKTFDFKASAAKLASFKSSLSPSPRPQFSPGPMSSSQTSPLPGVVLPAGSPLSGPMPMPGMYGYPAAPPPFVPGMMPNMPPPQSAGRPQSSASSGSENTEVKPLVTAFDFFAKLRERNQEPQKAFATPPGWATNSDVSYVDQFVPSPRMPPMMPQFAYVPYQI